MLHALTVVKRPIRRITGSPVPLFNILLLGKEDKIKYAFIFYLSWICYMQYAACLQWLDNLRSTQPVCFVAKRFRKYHDKTLPWSRRILPNSSELCSSRLANYEKQSRCKNVVSLRIDTVTLRTWNREVEQVKRIIKVASNEKNVDHLLPITVVLILAGSIAFADEAPEASSEGVASTNIKFGICRRDPF